MLALLLPSGRCEIACSRRCAAMRRSIAASFSALTRREGPAVRAADLNAVDTAEARAVDLAARHAKLLRRRAGQHEQRDGKDETLDHVQSLLIVE